MDGILNTFSNPWVLGAGAALGLLLLLSRSGSGGGSDGAYYSEGFLSESQKTQAALAQTAISEGYTLDGKRVEADTARTIAAYQTVSALSNIAATREVNLAESRAGVIRGLAATQAAVVIDRQQNMTRLGMTYAEGFTTRAVSRDRVTIANIEAKATKNAAMWGGLARITESAVKGAAMIAGA